MSSITTPNVTNSADKPIISNTLKEGGKEFLNGIWETLEGSAKTVWGVILSVKNAISKVWTGFKNFFSKKADPVNAGMMTISNAADNKASVPVKPAKPELHPDSNKPAQQHTANADPETQSRAGDKGSKPYDKTVISADEEKAHTARNNGPATATAQNGQHPEQKEKPYQPPKKAAA